MPRVFVVVALLVLILPAVQCIGVSIAGATVNESGYCWVPDVEFPVPCDDDDED